MKRARGRPPSKKEADFVHTWDDLAFRLKVTRRCLGKWREKFKAEPGFPRPRGDRHHVPTWLKFKTNHNLGKEPSETEGDDGLPLKAHWDRERARVDFEQAVYNFELKKEAHLSIDEITGAVGRMLAGFRTALNTMPSSAARWLIGLRDFNSIKDKLQDEVDAVLQALGRCDYLETLTPTVVAKIFPERDEAGRAEIARSVDSVFCELGRLALSDLLQRELPNQDVDGRAKPSDKASSHETTLSQSAIDASAGLHSDERNDSTATARRTKARAKPRKKK